MFQSGVRLSVLFLYSALAVAILAVLLFTVAFYSVESTWFSRVLQQELESTLGRRVLISKPLKVRISPEFGIVIEDFSIEDLRGSEMLKVGTLLVSAPMVQNWIINQQIDLVALQNSRLVFGVDETGKSNWDFLSSDEKSSKNTAKKKSVWIPKVQKISFDNVSLQLNSGSPWHSINIKNCELINDEFATTSNAFCRLEVDGQQLSVESKQKALNELINSEEKSASIKVRHLENNFESNLVIQPTGQVDARIKLSGKDLSSLSPLIKQNLPSYLDYNLSSNLSLDLAGTALRFSDLNMNLMGNDLTGELAINLQPLSVKSKLVSNKLNLEQLVAAASSNKQTGGDPAAEVKTEQEPRFPYSFFQGINADLDLQIEDFVTFLGLELANTHISATVLDGGLNVSNFKTNSLGADINGVFRAKNNELHLELKGKGFDANPVVVLTGGTPIIEGKFDLEANLVARGELLSEIKRTLAGNIKLSTVGADIKSSTLSSVSSGLMGILSPILGGREEAHIPCLLFNYQLKDGVAHSKEQVLKLGEAFIFAKGYLDIPKNKIKYDFHVNSVNPSLVSLIPPFQAVGALDSPIFMPSVSASVASLVDTTEGAVSSALKIVGQSARLLNGSQIESLSGLELCSAAFKQEQNMISSQIGSVLP